MRPIITQSPSDIPGPTDPAHRTFDSANTPSPKIALLGRLPYTVLVSNAGSGISRYGNIAINRWRVDGTRDNYGQWCYLRDIGAGEVWSSGHQPVCATTIWYEAALDADAVTLSRRDGDVETRTSITVSPDEAAEVRRVTVKNASDDSKEIELTSYQEVVLASTLSDRGHRAFGNLFVQTEWLADAQTLVAMRRPRSAIQSPVWCGHTIGVTNTAGPITCETDRSVFIGRGRSARNPVAMDNAGDLSGTVGAVLDPVLAIRAKVVVAPRESVSVVFTTFYAQDRAEALRLAAKFSAAGSEAPLSSTQDQQPLATADKGRLFQDLAGQILYRTNDLGRTTSRSNLIAMGITGEWPILFATVGARDGLDTLSDVISMHRYWHLKGLDCDLVIVATAEPEILLAARQLLANHADAASLDDARGVFVLDKAAIDATQIAALEAVARIQIDCDRQTLAEIANG